jgi:acyl-coenzyme A thioesterase PaaI-like protein
MTCRVLAAPPRPGDDDDMSDRAASVSATTASAATDAMHESMPLAGTLGVEAVSSAPDEVVAESKTNFLGAVTDGVVTARSVPLHAGGSTIVIETGLMAGERLVGKVTRCAGGPAPPQLTGEVCKLFHANP